MIAKLGLMCLCTVFVFTSCSTEEQNPLLRTWNTPRDTPPFKEIKIEHYKPAFEAAMRAQKEEIAVIVENSDPASFGNTIEALEKSGKLLSRVSNLFFNLNSAETNDSIQALARELSPLLTDHSNDILLNSKLFDRVKSVYKQPCEDLTGTERMLLENTYKQFVRNGANLSEEEKEKYREISRKLSDLTLKYGENVLAETNAYTLHLTKKEDLEGLPESAVEAAAATAKEKGLEGWVFTLQQPSMAPFLRYSNRRDLREQLYMAYNRRGANNNENNNYEIIREIVNLRLELANLLGFKTYADFVLTERMAQTSSSVRDFLSQLLVASLPTAKKDVDEVAEYAKRNGADFDLQRWDWSYYADKLKDEKYSLNEELLRPYFQLDKVIEGIFGLANRLYGLSFKINSEIQGYHPEVQCYEVFDENGEFLAVLYLDFFPRAGKQGGAWMTNFREQENDGNVDIRPIVSLVCNFTRPTETAPSLLTYDEVETFIHEFGHGLHGMLSKGKYASLSGTNVYRDFVELPSQIMENWMSEETFLNTFAVHYKTGEKIPKEYLEKISESKRYLAGYLSVRQLSFGILDMDWHSLETPFTGNVVAFEDSSLKITDLLPRPVGTMTGTAFTHIFSGGYAAGYYSYKWAEVLDADAFSVFLSKGIFDRKTANSFRTNILEKGGSEHPMELYKKFRGQAPTLDALLRREGFIR